MCCAFGCRHLPKQLFFPKLEGDTQRQGGHTKCFKDSLCECASCLSLAGMDLLLTILPGGSQQNVGSKFLMSNIIIFVITEWWS